MQTARYSSATIILHWLMAICIIGMLTSGFMMTSALIAPEELRIMTYQLHKSFGVVLIIAVVLRVLVRFLTRVPDLPNELSNFDKTGAKFGHFLLYVLMIALPLSGWVMVSASTKGYPTTVFWTFNWPHIHEITPFDIGMNKPISKAAHSAHYYLALAFCAVIFLHIAGFLKHLVSNKINLIKRIWWCKD